jgi:Tol biopolymer transport system component
MLSDNLPKCDGHPSVDPSGRWMVTDTYPKFDRMSRLYLYNFHTDEVICLGRLYQPLKYSGSYRIDLHPKWNLNGDKIYFESGHNGLRNFYALDVSRITNQE